MENLTNYSCSICNSTSHHFGKEYTRCNGCGTVHTAYNYDAKLYKESYANNYVKYAETPINVPLNLFRLGLVSRWLSSQDTILDIGCCIGEFIRFAEQYYDCIGFEPNKTAADMAAVRTKKAKIVTKLHKGIHVNCVTMFDVFEHIDDPIKFLATIDGMLKPEGILVLTTPNVAAIPNWADNQLLAWKHYKPKEHLFLYTVEALEVMTAKMGYHLLHTGTEESTIRPGNPNGDILTFVARKSL